MFAHNLPVSGDCLYLDLFQCLEECLEVSKVRICCTLGTMLQIIVLIQDNLIHHLF